MAGLAELLGHLDPDPRRRGQEFERLCVWWLTNDPRYRQKLRAVWLWDEWPGRDGPDTGIDVVAEDHDGAVWAIQCKAYSPTQRVTKRDVDAFLAESARPPFTYRLLVATTNELSANARRTMDRQDRAVGRVLLADLDASPVDWPSSPSALDHAGVLPPKTPRPHQQVALDAVVEGLQRTERGQLVMACGTGKSLVGLWAAEQLGAGSSLVLLPSLSLLAQTLREWAANASSPFRFLPVCSDETVADHMVAHTSELGLPSTTEPGVIAGFLDGDGPQVLFATYQSSDRVAECLRLHGGRLDLVIADEAHRTAGRQAGLFSTVLDDDRIPARQRLFMTATPRFYTGRVREAADDDGIEVASMDDEDVYGPELHRLGFAEAVHQGLLSDYRVVIVGTSDETYQDWIQRRRLVTLDTDDGAVTDARTLGAQVGLAQTMHHRDLRRVITFHNRVARARAFAEELPDTIRWMPEDVRPSGTVWASHVSGRMSSGQRDARLRQLAAPQDADRAVLSNAQCLSEGVDVPALDGVAFIEPRQSQVDIIQAVGRVMRKVDGKDEGTIILPIFIPNGDDDIDGAMSAANYRPIWSLVRALRAHDDVLAEEIDELRRERGRDPASVPRLPSKFVLDLPTTVRPDFARALMVRLVDLTSSSWEERFGALERYISETGHSRVPLDHTGDGYRLGAWVAQQRTLLSTPQPPRTTAVWRERRRRLDELPGWIWDAYDEMWDTGWQHLKEYVAEHNDAAVEQKHVCADGFHLGVWVARRRREYGAGRLSEERVQALEGLPGWVWDWREHQWMVAFEAVRQHAQRSGAEDVPTGSRTPDGRMLRHWISTQHKQHRRGQLAAHRAALLESLPGWKWQAEGRSSRVIDRDAWNASYEVLREYVDEVGHASPKQKVRFRSKALGRWVTTQRSAYNAGQLPQELAHRLEALDGWQWSPHDAQWEATFACLKTHARATGSADITTSFVCPDGHHIGRWVDKQRYAYRRGRMRPDRQERLEGLPGWRWSVRKSQT